MKPGLFTVLSKTAAANRGANQEFLDMHFDSPTGSSWQDFQKKLRSKTFLEQVQSDPRADRKLKRFAQGLNLHKQSKQVPTFRVPSQSGRGSYRVKYHPGHDRYTCDCGDWTYARSWRTGKTVRDCKHIKKVQTDLRTQGKEPLDFRKMAMAQELAALKVLELLNG